MRLAGRDLEGKKAVQMALSDLKGVSFAFARAVAYASGADPLVKIGTLSDEQVKRIEEVLRDPKAHGIPSWMFSRRADYETGADLHLIGPAVEMAVRADIARERRIRSRRGIRHELGLPVRGQRTRTTGRKGLTVGVKRKEIRLREEEKEKKEE